MAKFMILYSSDMKASELMANASQDEMKASMGDWMTWRDNASKTFTIDFGLPLEAVSKVTNDGASTSESKVGGYSIAEGPSKDELVELLKTHPHLKRPGSSIDVYEMLMMPGLESAEAAH